MASMEYTQIPQAMAAVLMRTNLSPYESRVLWVILRKTYGWHKREDWIALSQFKGMTGLAKSSVIRTLKKLVKKGIVIVKGPEYRPKIYTINENWWEWNGSHDAEPTTALSGNERVGCGANSVGCMDKSVGRRVKSFGCRDNKKLAGELPTKDTIQSTNSSSAKAEHTELVEHFCKKYRDRYHAEYVTTKEDFVNANRLVKRLGLEECKTRIDNAFGYEYWFTKDGTITFGLCVKHINELHPLRRKEYSPWSAT